MMPNLHNPIVAVPISLEVLRECLSEIYDLLRLLKTSLEHLKKRLIQGESEATCGTQIECDTHLQHEPVLCMEPGMCCDVAYTLQTEIVPAQSRP